MEIFDTIEGLVRDPNMEVDLWGFAFALLVSALVGILISAYYQLFYENRATGAQVHRGFLLMAPAITALFIAIQFSLPLSLGLLGALSVIRFRTPIKEPEEIAFILLLIAGAVICATFQFVLLGMLLGLALLLLLLQKAVPRLGASKRKDGMILVTLRRATGGDGRRRVTELIGGHVGRGKLESVSAGDEATTLSFSFTGFEVDRLGALEDALREVAPIERINIFFNKQGALF
ncbi:MAG: DUF4956 domain-containing protein [Candidatus Eisenbacteria bacterium]